MAFAGMNLNSLGCLEAEMEMQAAVAESMIYSNGGGGHYSRRRGSTLEVLEKELKTLTDINARQENRIENLQSKVNELIGFYLVFQGVVLTSVAQGSMLRCHNWWLPFSLSCIAAFAIILAVLHMLLKLQRCKIELDCNLRLAERLNTSILTHKQRPSPAAPSFSATADIIIAHDPPNFVPEDQANRPSLPLSSRMYSLIYPAIVLLILLTFTAFVLVSCRRILCFPGPLPEAVPPTKTGD